MSNQDEVLKTWKVWDKLPGEETPAGRLVDALNAWAEELGVSSSDIRRKMSAGRRAGMTYEQIVKEIP